MRHELIGAGVLACLGALSGCHLLVDRPASPSQSGDSGLEAAGNQALAGHVLEIDRLGGADPLLQFAIAEQARLDYVAAPTASNGLRYALVLATAGHVQSDPEHAQRLLSALLTSPEGLSPPERVLASVVYRDLDARLPLQARLEVLEAQAAQAERERRDSTSQRLQSLSAENSQLRRDLEEARSKLEAVAELEKALTTRHGGTEKPP